MIFLVHAKISASGQQEEIFQTLRALLSTKQNQNEYEMEFTEVTTSRTEEK